MKIVENEIKLSELEMMAENMFGDLVKAVIDTNKEIMVVDAPLHSDEEAELINSGSKQENLWGINLYPAKQGEDFIEFDSMINIRPNQNNRSRSIDDPKIREAIVKTVNELVKK